MLDGCQGKPRTPTIIEKICPQCGAEIEMFSIDTQMACEKCGFIAYNDTLSCVQWCQYARTTTAMRLASMRSRRIAGSFPLQAMKRYSTPHRLLHVPNSVGKPM